MTERLLLFSLKGTTTVWPTIVLMSSTLLVTPCSLPPEAGVQELRHLYGRVPLPDGGLVLPPVDVLLLDLVRGVASAHSPALFPLPGPAAVLVLEVLGARAGAGVHHVVPVAVGSGRQLEESLDEEDARVADLAAALLLQVEAL